MQVWLFKSMAVAPAGACVPFNTSRTWPDSITMVLSPSTLPATVSIRWPHSSAVTLGTAGASAAAFAPTDRSSASPALKNRLVPFIKKESRIIYLVQVVQDLGAQRFAGAALQH